MAATAVNSKKIIQELVLMIVLGFVDVMETLIVMSVMLLVAELWRLRMGLVSDLRLISNFQLLISNFNCLTA